jgi:hypothetical protein
LGKPDVTDASLANSWVNERAGFLLSPSFNPANQWLRMKAYLFISGLVFALIFVAHLARIVSEGSGPLRQPTFLSTSILSLGLGIWSAKLLFQSKGRAVR